MKRKLTKLIASILVLSFLVSAFSVLSFADTAEAVNDTAPDEETSAADLQLLVNRPFDEGWSAFNGFSTGKIGTHEYTIEYEETEDYSYNYFCRVESTGKLGGYLELPYGANAPTLASTVFEIDLRTDDYCSFGSGSGSPIIYFSSSDLEKENTFNLASIKDNSLILAPMGTLAYKAAMTYNVGNLSGEWIHYAVAARFDQRRCPECSTVYDLTQDNKTSLECTCTVDPDDESTTPVAVQDMTKILTLRVYFSYSNTFNAANAVKAPGRADRIDLNNTYFYDITVDNIASISSFFVGIPASSTSQGQSYCFDNVKQYNYANVPGNVPAVLGYGLNVDVTAAKTEEIIGSSTGKTTLQYISEGLVMKTGFDYCVSAGTRKPIITTEEGITYGAPVTIDGEVYVPLQAIIDWIDYPLYAHADGMSFDISTDNGSTFMAIGRKTVTANGELIELDAAPGVATDSASGQQYVVISKDDVSKIFPGYYVTYDDMGLIVVSAGENLFNRKTDLSLMLDVMKSLLYKNMTTQTFYDLAKETTDNFKHPYIMADQEQFDSLAEAYANTEDEALAAYLDGVIGDAIDLFTNYTAVPKTEMPKENKAFKLAMYQNILGKTLYFNGVRSGSSLRSTSESSEAVDVFTEFVYDETGETVIGYRLYFYNTVTSETGEEVEEKTYIRLYEAKSNVAGMGTAALEFVTRTPDEYYVYSMFADTLRLTAADGVNSYYLGTNNKGESFNCNNMATLTAGDPPALDNTYFPARLVTLITDNDEAFANAGEYGKNTMYKYLFDTVKNPSASLGNNGYDGGGRNPFLVETSEHVKLLAFAYQITRETKYAVLAYEITSSLLLWAHWAPAYFLDCAEASANIAIAYDWLYNVWVAERYDMSELEAIMYRNGLLIGYNYTNGIEFNENLMSNQGVYSVYSTATDSWNIIGTSAMAVTAFALLGTDYLNNGFIYSESNPQEKDTAELTYVKAALNLISTNIYGVTQIGLDMYAPDGSFIESPTKWSDATEALITLAWTLESVIGNDMNLSNTWALDKSFYYAYQVEYKTTDGYKYWNYHESVGDYISTDFAYYAAGVLGDVTIAAIRTEQIGFKPVSMWDVLAYKPEYVTAELNKTGSNFSLDYTLESCEGVISRSSWEDDALYVGVMGNANNAPGGQLDSGNFVYANKGIVWFGDLGAEVHTVYGYSDVSYRYGYYRHTAEGANTVIVTTSINKTVMPYGQAIEAGGRISDYYSSEYGMYTIINNSGVYLDKATSAKRGVLLTNNRRTVVVQDELTFKATEECAWVTQATYDSISLNDSGRTAILKKRVGTKEYTLRATILDSAGTLKFTTMNAYDTILSTVYNKESARLGDTNTYEIDRSALKRLVITQGLSSMFSVAVVFEMITMATDTVEYEYKSLDKWGPNMITDKFIASEVNNKLLGTPSLPAARNNSAQAMSHFSGGDALDIYGIESFFDSLVRVYNCEFWLGNTLLEKEVSLEYLDYKNCKTMYDKFKAEMNGYISDAKNIAVNIVGYEF